MLRQLKQNDIEHLKNEMQDCNVDPAGINIMLEKGEFFILKTSPLSAAGCNIIKQQMLSIGGEVAITRGSANCSIDQEAAILFGTKKQYLRLIKSLENQYFDLKELQNELKIFFSNKKSHIFKVGEKEFDLSQKTLIMGILNVTPDSFSDGGQFLSTDIAVKRAMKMLEEGADIIDIGGESTKPGAEKVDFATELDRVIPIIEKLRQQTNAPISIDTYKSEVANRAISAGANIVNDISGLNFDTKMADVIAKNNIASILMHIQGTPDSMQKNPVYNNMIDEILEYLVFSAKILLEKGLDKSQIALDPGIGFGKVWDKNFEIIRYLEEFKSAGFPILVGPSRKSFIGNLLNLPVEERLEGTLASIVCSVMNGVDIVRVHDIKETYRAVKVADKIFGKS